MSSSATTIARPRALPIAWHWIIGLLALIAAGVVAVMAQRVEPRMALYWVLGLGVGVVLQRGRLCFAGAFRDVFLMRNGTMLRAILVGLAIMTPIFALIEPKAVPVPDFGALPAGAHVVPLGYNVAIGGLMFGVGMVIAGGCVSGTLYRIGEGYLASWASLLGILLGLSLAAHTWNWWYAWTIQSAPSAWLPASLGYAGAVIVTLLVLAAAFLLTLWWETRGAGQRATHAANARPPSGAACDVRPASSGNPRQSGRARLGAAGGRRRARSAECGRISGRHAALGVTGELAAWADRGAGLLGLAAPPLLGADALAGCNLAIGSAGMINPTTLLDAGLVFGALLAALAAREFKVRVARQKRRYVQSFAGGSLMGYGAGIGIGCTIGAFFSAVPSLALSGWVFGLAVLFGAGVGTLIIRRIA